MGNKPSPAGGAKEKGGETSSQDLQVLFENLKIHSKDDRYQNALKVMQSAPIEHKEAFATIINTLLPPGGNLPPRRQFDWTSPAGGAKDKGGETSSQDLKDLYENLKIHSEDDKYQNALKVMQSAQIEHQKAFATLIKTFLPPAKAMTVLAYLLITGQTYRAHQQILDHLNAGPLSICVTDDVQKCEVILLFCPILSRVRSDVEFAFRRIPDGAQHKPVVLVLLHHTRKPDHVLKEPHWVDEFPKIIREVHMLYHESQKGLLEECPRNKEALQNLQSITRMYQDSK